MLPRGALLALVAGLGVTLSDEKLEERRRAEAVVAGLVQAAREAVDDRHAALAAKQLEKLAPVPAPASLMEHRGPTPKGTVNFDPENDGSAQPNPQVKTIPRRRRGALDMQLKNAAEEKGTDYGEYEAETTALLGKVQSAMQQLHVELEKVLTTEQNLVVTQMVKANPKLAGIMVQVRNKALKHQNDAIQLSTDLHITTQKFVGSYMKIEDILKKVEKSHLRWMPEITTETKADFADITTTVSATTDMIERLKDDIVNLEDYIKEGQERGMAKLETVKARVDDFRVQCNMAQKRLEGINLQNLKTIRDSTKEYDRSFQMTKKVLEMMPELLSEKALKLKEELLDQAAQRDEQLAELGDMTIRQNKKFVRELVLMVDNAAAAIGAVHTGEADMDASLLKKFAKDRKSFEKTGNKMIGNLVKDGQQAQREIGRSLRQTEQFNSMGSEKLNKQLQDWIRYPQDTVKLLDALKDQASRASLDERKDRDQAMATLSHQFQTTMARQLASEAKDMQNEVKGEQQKVRVMLGHAARGADAQVSPIVQEFDQLAVQAASDQQKVQKAQSRFKDLTFKTGELEEGSVKAQKRIGSAITAKDTMMLRDAKSEIESEHAALQRSMSYLEAAKERGVAKTMEREKELLQKFTKKTKEDSQEMKNTLGTMDMQANQLKGAAEGATKILEGKLYESTRAVKKIEGMLEKHNDRNFRGMLEHVLDESNDKIFGKEEEIIGGVERPAQQGVKEIADNAITMTDGMLHNRMESFAAKARNAVGGVAMTTKPLINKLKKEALAASTKIKKHTEYVFAHAADKLKDAAEVVEGTGHESAKSVLTNADAELKLLKGREDEDGTVIPGSLTNTVLAATNKVAAMDGEAKSAMTSWKNQINAEALTWSDPTGDEFSGLIPEAVKSVKEEAAAMKQGFLEPDEGTIDKTVNQPGGGVAAKLEGMQHDLGVEVDGAVSNMKKGATDLDESTRQVSMMAAEAEAYRTRTSAAMESDADSLNEAVASERQAVEDMNREMLTQIDKDSDISGTARELQLRSDQNKADVLEAARKAEAMVGKAGQIVHSGAKQLQAGMQGLKEQAEAKVNNLADSLSALRLEVEQKAQADGQTTQKLLFESEQMKAAQEQSAKKFENAIARTGRLLATLAEQDETAVGTLTQSLDSIRGLAKQTVETQDQEDTERLKRLQASYKDRLLAIQQTVVDRKDQIEAFQKRLEQVTSASEESLSEIEASARHFEEHLLGADRQFGKRVAEEKRQRQMSASEIESTAKQNSRQMSAIMGVIEQLEKKSTATVMHRLGTLDLDNKALERKLTNTLKLEQYQEKDAIQKVYNKLNQAREIEKSLNNWRTATTQSGDQFRDLIVKEFSALGHDLDLSKLELAEEQAAEQYAVDQQAAALRAHLGEEIHGLSEQSQDRIDALARRTARELAKLAAMEGLSKEERAKMMAAIKEKARREANQILEADGRIELEQKTAARHMQIATDEIQATLDRIAQIEDGGGIGHYHNIQQVFDKIQDTLHEIDAHSDVAEDAAPEHAAGDPPENGAQPPATNTGADTPDTGMPPPPTVPAVTPADSPANEPSLLETGATDQMLRVALAESEASIADDQRLAQRAQRLLPQFAL